jgi:glutaredoxin
MLTIVEMQAIAKSKNVIFYKQNCPFCTASQKLINQLLESKILDHFEVYILDKDFDNDSLGELAISIGWVPDGGQSYPSKPQIFVQGEYIGGNFEFYNSRWNVGQNMPNLKNPMRF